MDYIKYSNFIAESDRQREAYQLCKEAYASGNKEDLEAAHQLHSEAAAKSQAAFEELKATWD